jgi:nucleoside-diphosphate-sugar epimerase
MYDRRALVVGATGVSGSNLVQHLSDRGGWQVTGLSRGPSTAAGAAAHIAVDVLDAAAAHTRLAELAPTHLFFCAWTLGQSEDDNCARNGAMLSNTLDALRPAGSLRHVGIVTGMKHYLGPFEDFARNTPVTPFQDDAARLPGKNFYYALEDILTERSKTDGFCWNVHRSQMIIGYAMGNLMNMAVTIAVYATLCKATGLPFYFPGHPTTHFGLNDVTDARILALQMVWAAETPNAANEAFNVANGEVIRWRELWADIADYFGLPVAEYPGHHLPLKDVMANMDGVWDRVAAAHRLQPVPLRNLDSSWFTDLDLGRPMECVNSMAKARRFGFNGFQDTRRSFFDVFDQLRQKRIIP